MTYPLMGAPYNNSENEQATDAVTRKRTSRNKTLKRTSSAKVQAVKDCLFSDEGEDDGLEMGSFNPPARPSMSSKSPEPDDAAAIVPRGVNQSRGCDAPVGVEGYENLGSTSMEDYYRQHVPYFDGVGAPQTANIGNEEILNKLNQMLFLLQEQQEVRTSSVTEEIILYSFLGVFVIFVLDSFARAGKYVR